MKNSISLLIALTIISLSSCTRDFVCECSTTETDGTRTYIHSTYYNVSGTRFNLDDECPKYETQYENGISKVKRCGLQ